MFKATKYQLIDLPVSAALGAGARIYFQDQPQLRSQSGVMVYIQKIETFSAAAVPISPLSSRAVATAADISNGFLVLNVAGFEDLQFIPLATVNRILPDGAGTFGPSVWDGFVLDDLYRVDWTKSYVQIAAAPSGDISYLFGAYYINNLGAIQNNRL